MAGTESTTKKISVASIDARTSRLGVACNFLFRRKNNLGPSERVATGNRLRSPRAIRLGSGWIGRSAENIIHMPENQKDAEQDHDPTVLERLVPRTTRRRGRSAHRGLSQLESIWGLESGDRRKRG